MLIWQDLTKHNFKTKKNKHMAKKKQQSASMQRKSRLNNLIKAAQERYSNEELFSEFLERLEWREKLEVAKLVALDSEIMEEIKCSQKSEGFIVLKIEGMEQKEKLTDFLTTVIYPYYNEQQINLFN
jgi:hypothetical protein